jgi:amidohydrolase
MEDTKSRAFRFLDQNANLIRQLALDIHARPEPNFEEYFAAERAATILSEFGLDVETEVAELPTAILATTTGREGGPVVGLLGEYDCVPDVGHGCGHNLICAATVAAGIGLHSVMNELPGTVKVFGCPAEEGGKGKMYMYKKGLFDDLDAALQFHPATHEGVTSVNLCAQNVFFEFTGRPAHSTAVPWEGRNALDAVVNVYNALNAMRQQVQPDVRISAIILESPKTIASIPEFASMMVRVRAFDESRVTSVMERVKAVAQGAALSTETTVETRVEEIEPSLRCSEVIAEVLQREGKRFDLDFTHRNRGSGTTDLAYVGLKAPTLMYRLATWPDGTPGHSQAAVEASKSDQALESTMVAAKIMIGIAIDLLTDPELIARAREESQLLRSA